MSKTIRREPVHHRGVRVSGLWQRRSATGEVIYEARPKINGKLVRSTLKARTTAEAVRELEELKTSRRKQKDTSGGTTFAGGFDLYVERLRQEGRSPASITNAGYRYRHLSELHDKPLAGITRQDVAKVITKLRRAGAAGSSIRSYWALGSAIFSDAIRDGVDDLTVNPFALVRGSLPPMNRGAKREYTPDDVLHLLGKATKRQAPLVCLLGWGLRVSEAVGQTWADYDADTGVLHVTHQLGPDGERAVLKTEGSARALQLDARTQRILKEYRAAQMEKGLHRDGDFILATVTGRPMKRRQAHRMMNGLARRAGRLRVGESLRLHDLRAAFALAIVRAQTPLNEAQRMLGHATSQMTLEVYAKVRSEQALTTNIFDATGGEVVQIEKAS